MTDQLAYLALWQESIQYHYHLSCKTKHQQYMNLGLLLFIGEFQKKKIFKDYMKCISITAKPDLKGAAEQC